MVDANQCFTVSEAIRRAKAFEEFDVAWFEEPMPRKMSTDMCVYHNPHPCRSQLASYLPSLPFPRVSAAPRLLYRPGRCRAHRRRHTVAENGSSRETFDVQVCPHYLMEIHVALCAAVPNGAWVEFIPQLDVVTNRGSKSLTATPYLPRQSELAFHGIGRRSNACKSDTPLFRRRFAETEAAPVADQLRSSCGSAPAAAKMTAICEL